MKKVLLTSLIGILIYSCSVTKTGKETTRYFDENNVEISKSKFNRIRSTNKLLDIPGDSINHKKLTLREKLGKINDRKSLELLLEKATDRELDSDKPIVIIYYPGKDRCNSSGTTNTEWIKSWYGQLEDGLNQVAQVKPLYIFKDNDGLEKYNGILNWKKDPEKTIERLFFEYHYPCSSFVVISKNGDYISYFGEFGKEYVWEATQIMNK
ncbi:hypothetical protein [Leeuwenhoekiella marinoflava]|uniref:Uncharacterized protein n=2 Tax=Leeuwenhoekiella marinoflava TaxID=988 RepID=A0A4Q0PKY1_9FLAO|nr:hypothetical protein [Leeuwenhoekiella marinoflava]RXG29141.1 hypothetical protein DSL99_2079 [Leeuwenhoekiella marinoflava]SHF33049.1 hypothetical protein SAMN02745246_02216 [Leeuwenhoekiella marinoflava DSM 3653]